MSKLVTKKEIEEFIQTFGEAELAEYINWKHDNAIKGRKELWLYKVKEK